MALSFNHKQSTEWCELKLMERSCTKLPGNGSINIGDDYFVIPAPQIDCAMASTGALILGGHTEHDLVGTFL